jgi:hypothetical protein
MLDLRIVEVIEIVEDDDFMPHGEQFLGKMRPDKAGTACDQDSHGAKLATDGHGWTQILQLASSRADVHLAPTYLGFISLTPRFSEVPSAAIICEPL